VGEGASQVDLPRASAATGFFAKITRFPKKLFTRSEKNHCI